MKIEEHDLEKDYIVRNIGSGETATCYQTKDNKIYKKFNGTLDYNMLCLKYLSTLKSDYITFPEKLIYNGNELVGYIKEYAEGTEISKLKGTTNINNLIKSLQKLEKEIYELSEILLLTDLSSDNIVYDDKTNKMTIIDTDYFEPVTSGGLYKSNKKEPLNIVTENKKWINQSFNHMFRDCESINKSITQFIKDGYIGLSSTSYEFKMIINELQKITDNEINTLDDYYNCIDKAKELTNGKSRI